MGKINKNQPERSAWREISGILTGTAGLLLLLAILSYAPQDIRWFCNQPTSQNWIGPFGAYLACIMYLYFGVATYAIPIGFLWIGTTAAFRQDHRVWPRLLWFLLALFCLAGLADMNEAFWQETVSKLNIGSPGGVLGELLAQRTLGDWIGHIGAGILFFVLFAIALVRMIDLQMIDVARLIWAGIKRLKRLPSEEEKTDTEKKKKEKKQQKEEEPFDLKKLLEDQQQTIEAPPPPEPEPEPESELPLDPESLPMPKSRKKTPQAKTKPIESEFTDLQETASGFNYQLPSLDLLDPPHKKNKGMSPNEIASTAQVLQDALEEFGVEAQVTGVQQGPVVTCYEILPAPGVRVERIKSLQDNIALKMRAESIRIQAPIPGRGVCGVEIPNSSRASVFLREMIESPDFQQGKHALPLVLGTDVNGKTMIYDLAKMPHLLIAGATGAGKSVCMNSILTGLLIKHSPDTLRMILVDPKTVEFHAYNNLPHLVVPVITDAKKVALGLRWAIDEMERRFKWFRQAGVRDLTGFNARTTEKEEEVAPKDPEQLFGAEELRSTTAPEPSKDQIPETLPYIMIVIDELADLMAIAQAEIEAGISRLAAKSRAAGIHMILATQRPDVKVITGTIKANFPARIAFKVSQKVDSRTILDRMGADALLGRGDMLVLPPGSDKLIRSQGAFTSDDEIERITKFWKEQSRPEFVAEIHDKLEKPTSDLPEMDNGADDDILEQAIEVIRQTKRASTSSLQRRLRIGYTRAARIMDLLEERGIVGPTNGAGPREILIDLDGEIPQNTAEEENGTD